MEQEIQRIWILVSELSEQLAQNNRVAADLHAQIQSLKEQAGAAAKTTTLWRYTTDVSNEFFDSEVERTAVGFIIENQGLLQENKQLNSLMTDYEQTLETVMTKFRQHAQAASDKEMALLRHYEGVLQSSDGQTSTQTYDLFTLKLSLERLSSILWLAIKSESGEDTEAVSTSNPPKPPVQPAPVGKQESQIEALDRVLEKAATNEPEDADGGFDWAVEREAEIARLERENQELRRQLGILRDPDEKESEHDSNLLGQRHNRTPAPFGSGFIMSPNIPSPQPSLVPNPYSPAYPGAQGYNPPPTFSRPERGGFGMPNRGGSIGPAPPQITPRNTFAEGTFQARQAPTFPSFFRGAPPSREGRMDLAGGQPPLL